ncbi:hypothetical protein DDI_2259 [Dickeya dianthicola RNS04.9]|nr:hypothetical protein DDI_2259 [Dickeya dianthicola RNS04.9]
MGCFIPSRTIKRKNKSCDCELTETPLRMVKKTIYTDRQGFR